MNYSEQLPADSEHPQGVDEEMLAHFKEQLDSSPEKMREIAANEWLDATPRERRIASLLAAHAHPDDIVARGEFFRSLTLMRHFVREAAIYDRALEQIQSLAESSFTTPDDL